METMTMEMEIDDNKYTTSIVQQQNGCAIVGKIDVTNLTVANVDGTQQQQQTAMQPKTELQLLMERIKPSSYGQRRNYSSINISAEKWLMAYDAESLAKLENPPSLADGIGRDLEKDIRYLGCELIQSGSILLKLNQTAAATGQILFQRFYYQKSFVRYNFEHMVMACLLLASKIEEEPRKPRDVLNVYHRLKQLHQNRRNPGNGQQQQRPRKFDHLELGGRHYLHTKNAIIKAERRILNTLGFVVHVYHPHKLVYIYLFVLGLLHKTDDPNASSEEIRKSRQLLQRAWSYMNDGLRTDMFLRYTPETIACACIQLAVKTVDKPVVLPKNPFPWFELFDASDRDVRAISQMLLNLYKRKKAPSLDWILAQLEKQQQKLADEEKTKQSKALAIMKEAIMQRKSEAAAAVMSGSGSGDEIRVIKSTEKSALAIERRDQPKDRPVSKGMATAGKATDNSRDRERKERKEEKHRRSRSRDRVSGGKDRGGDREREKQATKRSRSRDEKQHRRKGRRSKSRSPVAVEAKRDKKGGGDRRDRSAKF